MFPWCVRSEITRVFSEMISQETTMLFSRAACVLAVCTFFATPLAAQSFNCRDAEKPDEVLICQNPQLAALDERMASMYFRLRNSLAGERPRQARGRSDDVAARAVRLRARRWLYPRSVRGPHRRTGQILICAMRPAARHQGGTAGVVSRRRQPAESRRRPGCGEFCRDAVSAICGGELVPGPPIGGRLERACRTG